MAHQACQHLTNDLGVLRDTRSISAHVWRGEGGGCTWRWFGCAGSAPRRAEVSRAARPPARGEYEAARRLNEAARRQEAEQKPVSYTHLTLPTTPYV